MPQGTDFSRALAEAFLSGPWTADDLATRANLVVRFGRYHKWRQRLISKILSHFPSPPPRRQLIHLIDERCDETEFWDTIRELPTPTLLTLPRPEMLPAPGLSPDVAAPALVTTGDLCEWLKVTQGELSWFADQFRRSNHIADGPLRHYRYRFIRKSSGRFRLLEIPKTRLKLIQRQILHGILDHVPPHAAAHAFRAGRSIATYVKPHSGRAIILQLDMQDFFPSIRASRVHALFRTIGYPDRVARWLTALCTHRTHPAAFTPIADDDQNSVSRGIHIKRYLQRHVPQGAPTSPALANLCARRLDIRLTAFAGRFDVAYTRYADDLLFSGGLELRKCLTRFRIGVRSIMFDEGFSVRTDKTRVLLNSQSQKVAGVVLNEHPNVPRDDYDRLKAILYNCIHQGAASQNRDHRTNFQQHLQGRIAYMAMINLHRGGKLQALFDQIMWPITGKVCD